MSEMSLDGQTQNFDYQYPNYQGNGNGNSWGPLLPFHTYTPAANPSVPAKHIINHIYFRDIIASRLGTREQPVKGDPIPDPFSLLLL